MKSAVCNKLETKKQRRYENIEVEQCDKQTAEYADDVISRAEQNVTDISIAVKYVNIENVTGRKCCPSYLRLLNSIEPEKYRQNLKICIIP
jgi:hypothetical protein